MDDLDRNLLELFAAEPRIGVLEASRRLGIARGTARPGWRSCSGPAWSRAGAPRSTRPRWATR